MKLEQKEQLQKLLIEMVEYNHGDAKRIQHFIKVHAFAHQMGIMEFLDENTLFTLETAALVHDIGIHNCEIKYGSCTGKQQELEGPPEAEKILNKLGYEQDIIDRVCYLVGHHHTYKNMFGKDYQILVEADFLVNLYEDQETENAIRAAEKNIFRTKAGLKLLQSMYGIK